MMPPRAIATMAPRPLLFGGGSRAQVLHLVADLCVRLAAWIERDHYLGAMPQDEHARVAAVLRLLHATAAAARE